MRGNSIGEFIDDILLTGGPEKEFTFRDKYYFLETILNKSSGTLELHIDEYDDSDQNNKQFLQTYVFSGKCFADCVALFEDAAIFDGLNIYQAEQEIEVLFG